MVEWATVRRPTFSRLSKCKHLPTRVFPSVGIKISTYGDKWTIDEICRIASIAGDKIYVSSDTKVTDRQARDRLEQYMAESEAQTMGVTNFNTGALLVMVINERVKGVPPL